MAPLDIPSAVILTLGNNVVSIALSKGSVMSVYLHKSSLCIFRKGKKKKRRRRRKQQQKT